MATTAVVPFVTVDEYLRTSYHPDVDYVDGEIEERNVGEWDHSKLQKFLLLALAAFEGTDEYIVVQEQRLQVSPTRFRVPDTCIIRTEDEPNRIISAPPVLCIEVLSPEDRYNRIQARCEDYLRMGVPEVWVFDPETMTVDVLTTSGSTKRTDGILKLEGTPIQLDLAALTTAMRRKNKQK
jgi:Uma2 family endonuclease